MKILICFMPYKNFMDSSKLNNLFFNLLNKNNKIKKVPYSDGGGNLDKIIFKNNNYKEDIITIKNCFNRSKRIKILFNKKNKIGLIELFKTMGKPQKKDIDPMLRYSFGVGQCIQYLAKKKITNIYIGTGGSLSTDCGIGMAHALNVKFYDKDKNLINKTKNFFLNSYYLKHINSIDTSKINVNVKKINIIILSDSSIYLCGKNGQINTYSKQKKISYIKQKELKKSFLNIKNKFKLLSKKNFNLKYLGSGGGVASMLHFLFSCKLYSGAKYIIKKQNLENFFKENDIIISGEGIFDKTSFKGKGLSELISLNKKYKKKLLLFVGQNKNTKKSKNYKIINLNFTKIPSKNLFIETIKKKITRLNYLQ